LGRSATAKEKAKKKKKDLLYSREGFYPMGSAAFILNESAAVYMNR
jgi:hypothetical protein